jgi:hypothetical protein
MGNNAARFCPIFLKSCAKYGLDPVPDLNPELEPKLFQSRNRNRNKSLWFHNTFFQIYITTYISKAIFFPRFQCASNVISMWQPETFFNLVSGARFCLKNSNRFLPAGL